MPTLDDVSARVLGALMEKEMTTPDAYPLSLNALLSACNQRSSREPVMDLDEEAVRQSLHILQAHEFAIPARDGGRVARYEHRVRTVLNLRRDETAVICLLLLRGAQTVGELRSRADRMFSFDDLAAVQAALDRLMGRDEPLVVVMAKAPGSREVRYRTLLAGMPATSQAVESHTEPARESTAERIQRLEDRLEAVEERLAALEGPVTT